MHVLAWLQKRQISGTKADYILEHTLYGRAQELKKPAPMEITEENA